MKTFISAVVLTRNEEKNIAKSLSSLSWVDEIIVIDDYSTDKTLSFPSSNKIKVYQHHLQGDFSQQRNYGLTKAKSNWILFIDADEIVSEELSQEIIEKIKSTAKENNAGFFIRRKDYFLGRWLKHGETGNIRFVRLVKKDNGIWRGRVHEILEVKGNIGFLNHPILHYSHQSVSDFLAKINHYSDLVAQYWMEEGRRISFWEILIYPKAKFFHNYILKLGFLDGVPGFIMAVMMSFHSFLARGKRYLSYSK